MSTTVTLPTMLVDGDDRQFRTAVHDALAFGARLQEVRNRLGEAIGLSGPAYSVLISIDHLSDTGEVGVSRVGEHLHLSGAFVTIEVGKLVKAGLVTKEQHPEDGRRVLLRVSKAGRTRLDALIETQRPVNDAIFAGLSAAQFQQFCAIISSLLAGTQEALALQELFAEQRRRSA